MARGEACEDSIKDLKNVLKADRLSCHRFWAKQFRLLLHSAILLGLGAYPSPKSPTDLPNEPDE